MFRAVIAVFVSVCLIGCTSMKAVEVPASGAPQISVGDTVHVTTRTDTAYTLQITEISNTFMVGKDDAGRQSKIGFDQIKALEVKKSAAAKTAGAGLGAGVLVAVVLFVVGIIAFGKAMESSGKN
jgi:hypothetical protein